MNLFLLCLLLVVLHALDGALCCNACVHSSCEDNVRYEKSIIQSSLPCVSTPALGVLRTIVPHIITFVSNGGRVVNHTTHTLQFTGTSQRR
jgi:hypothetical protein